MAWRGLDALKVAHGLAVTLHGLRRWKPNQMGRAPSAQASWPGMRAPRN